MTLVQRKSSYDLDERAAEATFLVNHPLLKEAFATLRAQYVNQITESLAGSPDLISAHAKVQVLREVEANIRSIITDKKMADKKGIRYD